MEAKHTPGPWRYQRENGSPTTGQHMIAGDTPPGYLAEVRDCGSGDVSANARLIAAAPELLEACQAMIEWDDREQDHAVDFSARAELCRVAFDKARAAIAKVMLPTLA